MSQNEAESQFAEEIEAAWEALGMDDYEGEDSLVHFIDKLKRAHDSTKQILLDLGYENKALPTMLEDFISMVIETQRSAIQMDSEIRKLHRDQRNLIHWLLLAYETNCRDESEQGMTIGEFQEKLTDMLSNWGYDPNLSDEAKALMNTELKYGPESSDPPAPSLTEEAAREYVNQWLLKWEDTDKVGMVWYMGHVKDAARMLVDYLSKEKMPVTVEVITGEVKGDAS